MKEYTVYFEIFGKKLKTTLKAHSRSEAKNIIKDKIVFNVIKENDNNEDYVTDFFKNIMK